MTTLTVNIEDKKTEKAVKAVLEALGVNYTVAVTEKKENPLNKAEQAVYERLKISFQQIKLHQEGKIQLKDARELLNEL